MAPLTDRMKPLNRSTIGPLLQAIRKESDLTQATIAEAVGLTASTVSKVEGNTRDTTTRALLQWVETCGYILTLERDEEATVDLAPRVKTIAEGIQAIAPDLDQAEVDHVAALIQLLQTRR